MPRLKTVSRDLAAYKQCLRDRGAEAILPKLEDGIRLFETHRALNRELESLRGEQNALSKAFTKSSDVTAHRERSRELKDRIKETKARVDELEPVLSQIEVTLPNWLADDVPRAKGDENALPIRYCGIPKVPTSSVADFEATHKGVPYARMDGEPFHHYQLVGTFVDQEIAGNVAQSRFYYEFDAIAILDLALTMYAIEFFRNRGYANPFMIPPFMMRRSVEEKITYFEAFQDTTFEIEKDGLLLVPSSEHSIVAYYADRIFNPEELPLRVMAWSPCFRREAGAHGRDMRGIFRVKQFSKVELHSFMRSGEDLAEVDALTSLIQEFMGTLGLPTRAVIVASGEMDKRALKQVDIETWLPAQGKYRAKHSIATVVTWISEKLKLRYGVENVPKELVQNVYATAVAVQRVICTIAENLYDHATRSIIVPDPLRKYSMGLERIEMDK